MTRFKTILVPIDLSPRSLGAARYACHLVEALDCEAIFLHVIRPSWKLEPAEEQTRAQILQLLRTTPGSFQIRSGVPGTVIVAVAKAEDVDLVLMSTRGATPLSRLLSRSVTAQVSQTCPFPVLAGIDNLSLHAERPIHRVLRGLSLGPQAKSVLRRASGFARSFNAALSIVHASERVDAARHLLNPERSSWIRKTIRDDIRALQADTGTNAEVWIEAGGPARAIPTVAKRTCSDLLVIGKSPGRQILNDLWSIPSEVMRRSPCPIVSV